MSDRLCTRSVITDRSTQRGHDWRSAVGVHTRCADGSGAAFGPVHYALTTGITDPHQLTAIVDTVITLGDRYADQLALFDL